MTWPGMGACWGRAQRCRESCRNARSCWQWLVANGETVKNATSGMPPWQLLREELGLHLFVRVLQKQCRAMWVALQGAINR